MPNKLLTQDPWRGARIILHLKATIEDQHINNGIKTSIWKSPGGSELIEKTSELLAPEDYYELIDVQRLPG